MIALRREPTKPVTEEHRCELQEPRFVDSRRGTFGTGVVIPSPQHANGIGGSGSVRPRKSEQERQDRLGVQRECVTLNGCEIVRVQFRSVVQKIGNPLRAVGLGPIESEQIADSSPAWADGWP